MKIQCACGAKYAFDATPEMLQSPVRLVCQSCGADLSDAVNELIRQEFAGQLPVPPLPVAEVPAAPTPGRLKISLGKPSSAPAEAAPAPAQERCAKHVREPAVEHCVVCGKPMCQQCMSLFGYVCSPLCRARAEAQNIEVPVYEGQASLVEARYWRKMGAIGGSIAAVAVLVLGFWFWYAWFGSVPHVAFSLRFDDRVYAGESILCGTNQIVFLHGGTLARCDLKSKKQIWSQELVTKQQIAAVVAKMDELQPKDEFSRRIPQDELEKGAALALEGSLQLHVSGQNIWVSTPVNLTHYDWDTGKVLKEISLADGGGELVARNDEFLLMGEGDEGQTLITHINPATSETRAEEIRLPGQTLAAATTPAGIAGGAATGGLPLTPGARGQMNPSKVAQQAQNLSLPGRIALPAILANTEEQQRIAAAADDDVQTTSGARAGARQAPPAPDKSEHYSLVPGPDGYVELAVRLLESHIVTREAMKAPPKKSALNGDLNTANESAAINEQLNEMQRNLGSSTVEEDESLYQVSLRRPDSTGAADWSGQVTGPPALFPLKTVNVLAAGKTLIVFDKTNKKLWQAALTYRVEGGRNALEGETSQYGEGPCVERGDTLYVADQAVLTAFDLQTGNARWRLPSVGVLGLFFDDKGMLYVNTTTADPENIKYSKQIDITQKIEASLLKIDPQTGKTLWSVKPGGAISYLSGKFIYTVQAFDPGDMANSPAGVTLPPYLKIRRISAKDGRQLWDYEEDRAPLDVQFQNNTIALVFKKEVEVLKFISF